MNQLLAFPWIRRIRTDNVVSRYTCLDHDYRELLSVSFQTADKLFCYRVYNRNRANTNSVIVDEKYGFTSLEKAMKACDAKLIELGYELVTEERTEKLRLLL